MPYCPKCGMEFVDGIQVCSDCKSPLLSSPEEAKALQEEAEKKALEEFLAQVKEEGNLLEQASSAADSVNQQEKLPSSVYVKKAERYQDRKSSASAFLLIGCAALLLSALIFTEIIPIIGSSRIIFGGLLGIMGIACLIVCLKTRKEAAGMKAEADEEDKKTQELINWFVQTHSAQEIDQKLAEELGGELTSTPEELSLKRFSLIQDYLAVEKDLPDQAYIDALSEEIYSRIFE